MTSRRDFMGAMGLAGASLATSSKSLFAGPTVVPVSVIQSGLGLNIALVQQVDGGMRDTPYKPQSLIPCKPEQMEKITRGYKPRVETEFKFEPVAWAIKNTMKVVGVRVWGAKVCGEQWTKYAAFSVYIPVNSGDELTISYTIVADYNEPA